MVEGRDGRELYVRVGGSDDDWSPDKSGYSGFVEYARGAGWKVWGKVPGATAVQQAPLKPAFPIPTYTPASEITVSDAMADF